MSDDERSQEQERAPAEASAAESAPEPPAEEAQGAPEDEARARIQALERELAELKEKWLRALAEADNARKRAEREVEQARKYAIERFALALLDVVDNLERALEAEGDVEALREGVRLTLQSWRRVMEQFGMERIDAVGEAFDPHQHEALMQTPSDEHPEGVVVAQHVPGYKLAGRLLRPAKVVVSSGPPSDGEERNPQGAA